MNDFWDVRQVGELVIGWYELFVATERFADEEVVCEPLFLVEVPTHM